MFSLLGNLPPSELLTPDGGAIRLAEEAQARDEPPPPKLAESGGPRADRNSSNFSGSAFPNLIPCAGPFPLDQVCEYLIVRT